MLLKNIYIYYYYCCCYCCWCSGHSDRDVFNEKPSKEEQMANTEVHHLVYIVVDGRPVMSRGGHASALTQSLMEVMHLPSLNL